MSFNPSQHPRGGKGTSAGGKFVSANQSQSTPQATGAAKRLKVPKVTTSAIMDFQRRHGLVVDGVIGRQTAAALLGDSKAAEIPVGALTTKQIHALRAVARGALPATLRSGTPKAKPTPKPTPKPATKAKSKAKLKPGQVRSTGRKKKKVTKPKIKRVSPKLGI